MINHWPTKYKLSLAIHAGVVLIPFSFSTVSALFFWHGLFDSWWLAAPMVLVIDALALLGLILYVGGIPSPFVGLRHLLPFISIVPLGLELYALLEHNGKGVALGVTALVTLILVTIAWKCFTTIEHLFVSPIDAAREKAREHVGAFSLTMAQLEEMNLIVDNFAIERMRYHAPLTASRIADQPAYPAPKLTRMNAQLQSTNAEADQTCPKCGARIESRSAWLAARRWKQCANCKEK